jgi:hypothetical protein
MKKIKHILATALIILLTSHITLPLKAQVPLVSYTPVSGTAYNHANANLHSTPQIPFVSYTPVHNVTYRNLRNVILEDGIYELIVNCCSHTSLNQNYTLDVNIKDDTVTHIYFGNDGYGQSPHR